MSKISSEPVKDQSIVCESASFFSAQDFAGPSGTQSFLLPKQLCDHQIVFNDQEQNLRFSIQCLEECQTAAEINRHKTKCSMRCGTKAFEQAHTHETAKIFWEAIKNTGLAPSLLKVINEDLSNGSCAQAGVTKLRSNVCMKNIDVYGLNNSSTLHFAKSQNRMHDRLAKQEISLNSEDIRLIAGAGESINSIQKMVTQMHKQNIPTEKGVVQKIRSERQNVLSLCENIVCHNVKRRTKHTAGQSHLGQVLE